MIAGQAAVLILEPPDLANEIIITSVQASYSIPVAALTFLPIGNDSSAWVYRVHASACPPVRYDPTHQFALGQHVTDQRKP